LPILFTRVTGSDRVLRGFWTPRWTPLRLLADFKTSEEIADALGISARTVENHRTDIAVKLNLDGSRALSRFAALHREWLR
jgi:DNA-binding NarL/FixJ family response regulator